MQLEDTTAFVTGASRGIGRAIAVELADRGAEVALAARSDGIYETEEEIDSPERTLAVETDVSDGDSVEASVEETLQEFGGVDVLVNNAGVAGPVEPFERVEVEDWRRVQRVNVEGAWLCAKHASPHLRDSDRGSVVNVASVAGKYPYPNRAPYAASKMALLGLTRTLAFELGTDDVTVNAVCPGPVQGERMNRAMTKLMEIAEEDGVRSTDLGPDDLALQQMMVEPEDVTDAVAWLAGPDARHVTAQDFNVDNGLAWY